MNVKMAMVVSNIYKKTETVNRICWLVSNLLLLLIKLKKLKWEKVSNLS